MSTPSPRLKLTSSRRILRSCGVGSFVRVSRLLPVPSRRTRLGGSVGLSRWVTSRPPSSGSSGCSYWFSADWKIRVALRSFSEKRSRKGRSPRGVAPGPASSSSPWAEITTLRPFVGRLRVSGVPGKRYFSRSEWSNSGRLCVPASGSR